MDKIIKNIIIRKNFFHMLIVILSVIRIKYIVSTPEKSMLYYSTMSVPKNKQYLDPHKIVIIFCLFVF